MDRRERLRGADVTHGMFIFTLYRYLHNAYKSSDYRKTRLLKALIRRILYTCKSPEILRCGTKIPSI